MFVQVGDAYVDSQQAQWTIGTDKIELSYCFVDNQLKIVSFINKACTEAVDYVTPESSVAVFSSPCSDSTWKTKSSLAEASESGGRPVVTLVIALQTEGLAAEFHAIAFPQTSVITQWVEFFNIGQSSVNAPTEPFAIGLDNIASGEYSQYKIVGGNSKADQGMLQSNIISSPYQSTIESQATYSYMPWTAFRRNDLPSDGWFVALEYLVNWQFDINSCRAGSSLFKIHIPDLEKVVLAPNQKIKLPEITICTFAGSLDDMAIESYDWQYQYMWDYTNMDYYAKTKWAVPWTYCAQNVQEQFSERLAYLDMDADIMRYMGFDMMWDDAGWSMNPTIPEDSYASVFSSGYESPDYSLSLQYLKKMGMKWLAWFVGRPSSGVMDAKVGAWGDFEWRTDGVPFPDWESDQDLRDKITHFLDNHPGCSFHTCSGGSYYSHTFGIQRLANTNYFADNGRGDQTNYYFSYIEPPDKWVDIIEPFSTKCEYTDATSRRTLTFVSFWPFVASPETMDKVRIDNEIYHYLLREGVAGRWSYMFHPVIKQDDEAQYSQRTSRDFKKALIITKHKVPPLAMIYPVHLLPEHEYTVGFESNQSIQTRTGRFLMDNGIAGSLLGEGDLIYLGMPGRPRGGSDTTPPMPPANVMVRNETNIGHSGHGIYWSAGYDENWISGYDVERDGEIIERVSIGTYSFDRSPARKPNSIYRVRTVDTDGNVSDWTAARYIKGEPLVAYSLGGLFPDQGTEGWYAETSSEAGVYKPMTFVRPASTSAADMGGSPNRRGGIEGCWEGENGEIVARAWQQASESAICVRRWDAPASGRVRVVSRVMKEYYRQAKGEPLAVRILHNDRQAWPESGWAQVPLNDLVGLVHDVTLDVARGDSIRFELARGTQPENDIVGWMPRIEYQEDPVPEDQGSVVRISCGASVPYSDSLGNIWLEDQHNAGGEPISYSKTIADAKPSPADQDLYLNARSGKDFTYRVPVKPGLYSVVLRFTEPEFNWIYQRPFNIAINGREMESNFDICQRARGPRKLVSRIYRYVVPNAENSIVISLTGGYDPVQTTDSAIVQTIEILPELKPVARINCGGDSDYVDWNSFVWNMDTSMGGGTAIYSSSPVSQASPTPYDQALYNTASTGRKIEYCVPMPQGHYSVHLKFAELWANTLGLRPMDITINGNRVRTDWDPASSAGELNMAADFRVEEITPDSSGCISIVIDAKGTCGAILQGIEIQ